MEFDDEKLQEIVTWTVCQWVFDWIKRRICTYFHCQLEERNFKHFVARIRTLCTFTKITFLGVFGAAEVDAKINDLVKNGDGGYGTFFLRFSAWIVFWVLCTSIFS